MAIDFEDPEVKSAIEQKIAENVQGLKEKNDALIDEKRNVQSQLDAMKKDLEALGTYKQENEAQKLASQGQYEKALESMRTQHTEQLQKANTLLETKEQVIKKMIIDAGLNDALLSAGVRDEVLLSAAKALFRDQVSMGQNDDGMPYAIINDKPIDEFFAAWKTSDEAKRFIAAPINSGGGSTGGGVAEKPLSRDEMTPQQKSEYIGKHGLAEFQKIPQKRKQSS